MPDPYVPGSQEGLPVHARNRLAAMRPGANQKGLFTSDLSRQRVPARQRSRL